jgi:HNH endonuclease
VRERRLFADYDFREVGGPSLAAADISREMDRIVAGGVAMWWWGPFEAFLATVAPLPTEASVLVSGLGRLYRQDVEMLREMFGIGAGTAASTPYVWSPRHCIGPWNRASEAKARGEDSPTKTFERRLTPGPATVFPVVPAAPPPPSTPPKLAPLPARAISASAPASSGGHRTRLVSLFHSAGGACQECGAKKNLAPDRHMVRLVCMACRDHNRGIPDKVRRIVWKRDGGSCVQCKSTQEIQYDHIIPYSRGGSSKTSANIRLLCGPCNRKKRDNI